MSEVQSQTESEVALSMVPAEWENDREIKVCGNCEKSFSLARRKHHCRCCGRIFCNECSPHRDELPLAFEVKGLQRTCDSCHQNLQLMKMEENPTSVPSRPDVVKVRDEVVAKLKALMKEPEDTWVLKVDKRGVTLHAKKIKDSSLVCVRSVITIPVPLEMVFAIYNDKDAWRQWQADMLKCKTIETVSETSEYIYILYNVPVLNNRDVCIYSEMLPGTLLEPNKPRAACLVSQSVVHPLCPKVPGCVRAIINMGYTSFEEVDVNGTQGTRVIAIYHTDPKGIVPPRIVNATIGKGAGQMADMGEYMGAAKDVSLTEAITKLQALRMGAGASGASTSKSQVV